MREEEAEELLRWHAEKVAKAASESRVHYGAAVPLTDAGTYTDSDGRRWKAANPIVRKDHRTPTTDPKESPEAWGRSVGRLVKQYVGAEIAKLEQRTLADAFQGPWLPQRTYRRGALVQHGGSAWLALADTKAKPGEGEGWRLLVKGAK